MAKPDVLERREFYESFKIEENELARITLADLRAKVDQWIAIAGPEAVFQNEIEYYGYGDDCDVICTVGWTRLETDLEYEERIAQHKAAEAKKRKQQRDRRKTRVEQEKAKLRELAQKYPDVLKETSNETV